MLIGQLPAHKMLSLAITAVLAGVDRTRNFRENYTGIPQLAEDIKERGLQEEPWVLVDKDGKVLEVIKGYRRLAAIEKLLTDDPESFKTIRVRAFQNLSPHQIFTLKLDHGQRVGLSKSELFNALCQAFEIAESEKDVAVGTRGLLEQHFPADKKITTDQELLNHYRGVIQTAKRAWESPEVVTEAWRRKMRGEQAWPTNGELKELHKVYRSEVDNDKTNKINRQAPGPKFMEKWEKLVADKAAAAANGESRPKSSAMMNREQVENAKRITNSRFFKSYNDVITRKLSGDKLPLLDKLQCELEKTMTAEQIAMLDDIIAAADDTSTAPVEQQKDEEVAAE